MPFDKDQASRAGKKSGEARRKGGDKITIGEVLARVGLPYDAVTRVLARAFVSSNNRTVLLGALEKMMQLKEEAAGRVRVVGEVTDGRYLHRNPGARCPLCGCKEAEHEGFVLDLSNETFKFMLNRKADDAKDQ